MEMVETVVAALRRSALAVLRNLWLLFFEVVNSLCGPLLMGGGLLLPLAFWWLTHGMPSPENLARDPLGFMIANWTVLVWSFAGWSVGACLYLLIWLFYSAALTGAIGMACGNSGGSSAGPVKLAEFWRAGRCGFSRGTGIASVSALITIPPLVPLLALAVMLIRRLPELITGPRTEMIGAALKFGIPLALLALLFGILSWLALVWYRYALCFAVVRGQTTGQALRSALSFFRDNWKPVIGLAVSALVIGILTSLTFAQAGFMIERLEALNGGLPMIVSLLLMPVGFVFGVFMNIWMHSAVVTLFLGREERT